MADFMYGQDQWADIDDLIKRWVKRSPGEYKRNIKWVREARNEYKQGKHVDRPLRKSLILHPQLIMFIREFYPYFFDSNDDVRKFSSKYREFVVDDGVLPLR